MLRRSLVGLFLLAASATLALGQDFLDSDCSLHSDCPTTGKYKELYRCENGECVPTVCGKGKARRLREANICHRKFKSMGPGVRCGEIPRTTYRYCLYEKPPPPPPKCRKDEDCALGEVCELRERVCVVDVKADRDRDGVPSNVDNCPDVSNPGQSNLDGDDRGDKCDDDIDGDDVPNSEDNCPLTPNKGQRDRDGEGVGDACDPDRDNDGIPNASDECPLRDAGNVPPDHSGCPPS